MKRPAAVTAAAMLAALGASPGAAAPPSDIVTFLRWVSGKPHTSLRMITEKNRERLANNDIFGATNPPLRGKGKGFSLRPSKNVYVHQSTAQQFNTLLGKDTVGWTPEQQAVSLLTLLHEGHHASGKKGWVDEGKTEAWALRNFNRAYDYLGLDPTRRAAMLQYAVDYHRSLPKEYQRYAKNARVKPNGTLGFDR